MNPALQGGFVTVMAMVYALLTLATVTGWGLTHYRPERDFQELRQRIYSWWGIVLICTLALGLNRTLAIGFFGLLSVLAFREYLGLVSTRAADRRVVWWAYATIPVQYFWVVVEWYGMFIIFIPVYVFLLLPVGMVLAGETRGYLRAAGTLQWGLLTTVFSLSHLAYLMVLPDGRYPGLSGPGLVLYLLVLTELNDVAQYCWGKLLGRHRVTPKVSPNKTWEGFLGGIATTLVMSYLLAPLLTPLGNGDALRAGLLIAVAGFFGDLSISALKRDLSIKDSGDLLPGHGGILDRLDSLVYTAPLFFHFCRYYYF